MQHLAREFLIECLLSLIEFIQFQEWILENMFDTNYNDNDNSLGKIISKKCKIKLPESIPQSSSLDIYDKSISKVWSVESKDSSG